MAPLLAGFQQQTRGFKKGKKEKKEKEAAKKARKGPRDFIQKDLKDVEQFALCDAMR